MNNQLFNQTLGAIISILQILIPLCGAFYAFYKGKGVEYIKSKIGLIKDEATRKEVDKAFDRVVELLDTEITNAENTAKPLVLQKIAEGKLNKDSLKEIGVNVAKTVMNQLPEKTINLLQQEVNDVNKYVNSKLEDRLDKLKQDSNSGVSKTVISEVTVSQSDMIALANQLQQVQSDKDSVEQQLAQIQNDKLNVEQTNQQLSSQVDSLNNEKSQLSQQVVDLTNKLNTITNTLNSVVQPTPTQADVNGINVNTLQ